MANLPLYDFIGENRDELIRRCRSKVATRSAPLPTKKEIDHGVPCSSTNSARSCTRTVEYP